MARGPKRTRIALVTYAMHCGGMESFLLRLARYLHQRDYDVELITTVEPGEWFGRVGELQIRAEHIAGYRPSGGLAPLQHSLRVSTRLARGRYDVILLNHARHAQAALARLPENVVVIPVLHNDVEEIYQVGCGNQDAWNVAVAVGPKVAATARQRLPHRPVLQLWSGVDLPEPDRRSERPPITRHRVELIYVGRLDHAQKGVLWLPEIHRACLDHGLDASLTIVGDGPDGERLQARFSELDLSNRTRHLKGLTPEVIYGFLQQAHILLSPSQFEGLPLALLESQACGCVPVASLLPGITDAAVEESVTGVLVKVGDVSGFARAVVALCDDPGRWSAMSEAGHARIERTFSVDTMGQSYRQLITDALNGHYPLPRRRKDQAPLVLGVFSWREFLPDRVRRLGRQSRGWIAKSLHRRREGKRPAVLRH